MISIIEILKKRNGESIKHLADELNVSEMTVHRDLKVLVGNNIAKIVHGAAIYNPNSFKADNNSEYNVIWEQGVLNEEKTRIGKYATTMIKPGDLIALDIGTTTSNIAKFLPVDTPISVMCFTVNILNEIMTKNIEKLMFSGGFFHSNTQLFECDEMLAFVSNLRFNKYFMSTAGIDKNLGLTCANQYESDTKQTCIKASAEVILVADSSKFNQVKPAYFADLSVVDTIITDSNITEKWKNHIDSLGIDIRIV